MARKYILGALALILTLLSACGSAGAPAAAAPTSAPTSAPAPTASAPTSAPTSAPVPTSVPATAPAPTAAAMSAASGQTITDRAGRLVSLAGQAQRIISLAPSNTEILFALDLGPQVVAVDDFSDYPAAAKGLPKIGGTNNNYNFEQIVALKPDLVLAAGITPPDVVKKLEDLRLAVVVANVTQTSFDSILSDIVLVGQITGRTQQAQRLTDDLRQRFAAIKAKVAAAQTKLRVYWELDATDVSKPFTVGPGNFVNDLIGFAGGANIFGDAGSPYPQVGLEQVVAANPEVIILSDVAYGITIDSVLKRPGWSGVAAVKEQRVYPIDDNLVSRPGPRIADGLEAVAKLIHPELFP